MFEDRAVAGGLTRNERRHMSTTRFVWGVVLLLVFSGACGYRMARFDNPELEGFTTIAIPYFENKTYEPGLDAIFTYAFNDTFIENGRLQVVGLEEADLVLRGKIKKVEYDSLAMTPDKRALEWRVWVTTGVIVEERKTGRVLWQRGAIRYGEEYRTSDQTEREGTTDNLQLDTADKRRAFKVLAADIADQVHDGLMQGF